MIYKPFPDNDITRDEALYIREIQEMLRALEFAKKGSSSVPVDGIYSPETATAVKEFQRFYNLPETGVTNRQTFYKLVEQYNALFDRQLFTASIDAFSPQDGNILRPEDTGDTVAFLNIILRAIADRSGNVPRPSMGYDYSSTTEAAVRVLQSAMGLPATGLTNRQTWNRIAMLYNSMIHTVNGKPDTKA